MSPRGAREIPRLARLVEGLASPRDRRLSADRDPWRICLHCSRGKSSRYAIELNCILIDFVQDLRTIGQQDLEEIACEEIGGSVRQEQVRFPSTNRQSEGEGGLSYELSSQAPHSVEHAVP
jgi:hypothetical protein